MALHYAVLEEGDGEAEAEARGVRAAAEKANKQVVFKYSSKGSKVQ